MKIAKVKEVLRCSECDHIVYFCYGCFEDFKKDDKIICIQEGLKFKHYHEYCIPLKYRKEYFEEVYQDE